MDELDTKLRKAMQALERSVPASYFDELPSRIEARLEVMAMAGTETESDRDHGAASNGRVAQPTAPREETSGLHDIKALAQSTKQRISKRINTESDAEESLLHSSTSGLRAVALPEPSKEVAMGSLIETTVERSAPASGTRTNTGARPVLAASAASDVAEPRGGLPVWIYAAVGAVAVAAVVFFVIRGSDKKAERTPASTAAGTPVGQGTVAVGSTAPIVPPMPGAAERGRSAGAPATESADLAAATPSTPDTTVAAPAETGADKAGGRSDSDDRSAKTDRDKREGEEAGTTKALNTGGAGAGATGGTTPPDKAPGGEGKLGEGDGAKGAPPADKVKTGGGTSLEDLLNEASGGAANPTEDTADKGDKKPAKTKLDSADIRSGMQGVSAQSCFEKYGVPGNVQVKFTVEPSGKVTKATATGSFKGTDTGNCVAGMVGRVSFPAFDGAPMSFTYPFLLSE